MSPAEIGRLEGIGAAMGRLIADAQEKIGRGTVGRRAARLNAASSEAERERQRDDCEQRADDDRGRGHRLVAVELCHELGLGVPQPADSVRQ